MSGQPRPHFERVTAKPLPPVPKADYSDELTSEQIDVLRTYAPQDESQMGELVYELTW